MKQSNLKQPRKDGVEIWISVTVAEIDAEVRETTVVEAKVPYLIERPVGLRSETSIGCQVVFKFAEFALRGVSRRLVYFDNAHSART